MAERDLLICGTCSSQFFDLKIFIDHKETCGHTTSPLVNNALSPQQIANIGSQQIVIPPLGHASIVSFPIGMPHVLLQTPSGAPQMYRLVLEPSINSQSQISSFPAQTSQSGHIYNSSSHYNTSTDKPTVSRELQRSVKLDFDEKNIPVVEQQFSLNESTIVRVSSVNSVETSWSTQRCDERTLNLDSLSPNDSTGKVILDQTSAPNLPTEEEVTTFLATQNVSQSLATQNPKVKENLPIPKQNSNSNQSNRYQTLVPYIKENETQKAEKVSLKPQTSQKGPAKNGELTKESPEKESKKKHCSFENCDFVTLHKKDLVRHLRKHTGEKPFQCSICGLRLSRQDKLKVHQRIHSKERPYFCTEPGCSYRGNEKAHLKKHRRIHTNERPFSCQFCPYGARDRSHLTVHLRSHTGDTPFHCQVEGCAAMFKTSSDLKRHEMLHTGEKPFKCHECTYTSALKANLRVHILNNHNKIEKYSCKSCPFVCVTKKQLKEHEKNHAQTTDSVINYKTTEEKSILSEYEKQTSCSDITMKKLILSKGRRRSRPLCLKNFKCEICGSGFVREDSFRSHIRQHERKNKEKGRDNQLLQTETVEQDERDRMKPLYPLNYILQNNAGGMLRECLSAPKETQTTVGKEGSEPSGNISQCHEQTLQAPDVIGNETFSTYMIAIDGISTMYSSGVPVSKEHQSVVPDSLVQGHDSVVHILSPSSLSNHEQQTPDSHVTTPIVVAKSTPTQNGNCQSMKHQIT